MAWNAFRDIRAVGGVSRMQVILKMIKEIQDAVSIQWWLNCACGAVTISLKLWFAGTIEIDCIDGKWEFEHRSYDIDLIHVDKTKFDVPLAFVCVERGWTALCVVAKGSKPSRRISEGKERGIMNVVGSFVLPKKRGIWQHHLVL